MDWQSLRNRLLRWRLQGADLLRRSWSLLLAALSGGLLQLRRGLQQVARLLQRVWSPLRERLPQQLPAWWPGSDPPAAARRLVEGWHKGECWLAVVCFGFIAGILILDVLGREFLGPFLRLIGLEPGATGIFSSQKLSIFALVIGSFAGIGIATATGAHIVPAFASGWVPAEWRGLYDRAVDVL